MLNRLPAWLPTWRELERDLGTPSAEAIGQALDVSASTVRRWRRTEAPRTARLALWWLTRWGHSAWDCEMAERTRLALHLVDALQRDMALMARTTTEPIHQVSPRNRSTAANEPSARALRAAPWGPAPAPAE